MALPDFLERLHADSLRQLDEEGWMVSAQGDKDIHLVSDIVGSPRHVYIRLVERDSEIAASVELVVDLQTTQTRRLSAPATNIANLLDVSLDIAANLLASA